MNRFHWHLTDDQGWRIEIKKYPKYKPRFIKTYGTKFFSLKNSKSNLFLVLVFKNLINP